MPSVRKPPIPRDAPLVVVVDDGYGDILIETEVLQPIGARVVLRPCQGRAEAVRQAVRDADAVLVRESPIDAKAVACMPHCRAVVRYGVGTDNVDLDACQRAGIPVANVPDYGVSEVSDHALALMLAVGRRVTERDTAIRAGDWGLDPARRIHRFAGATLGLIGAGRIGREFGRKAQGLGFARVLAHDPSATDLPPDWRRATIDQICAEAEVISVHAPLTGATRHLIDARRLALMSPRTILINSARGGLIDTAALASALTQGQIFGAGLDVFEIEPPDLGHPIFAAPNTVLTDHIGWYSEASVADLRRKAATEVLRLLTGQLPHHAVNISNRSVPDDHPADQRHAKEPDAT